MELTEVEFWNRYWEGCALPNTVDVNFSFDRCLSNALRTELVGVKGEVLEVGCAPGKWLAFMAAEFGLKPSGIEYSPAGMKATAKNFQILGLPLGDIHTGDFFKIEPSRQYDVVMSFGFIEHFTDADSVVERHLQWLKPGGTLILGVPNFRGIYYFLQKILDQGILDKHNLDVMRLSYFEHLADRYRLNRASIRYIGSFEPSLPIAPRDKNTVLLFVIRGLFWVARLLRRIKLLDAVNGPFISSYILAVYKKGERA